MPKTPMKYANTIMYKIVCKDLNVKDLYVGHTTNWTKRKCQHKSDCCNENSKHYHLKVYKTIREYGGWENWEMIEIEKYPCNDKNEARKRERFWYEDFNAQLNTKIPYTTDEEIKEHQKEHRQQPDVKQYIKEQQKKYYQDTKESKKEYKKEYLKKYYEANKQKILKQNAEKDTCECGSIISHGHMPEHRKSKKHIKYMDTKL